jgi:hypothetical protein
LTQGAKKADRSLNAEIVRRLELSFGVEEDRRRVAEDDLVKLAEEHSRKARELQVHITAHLLAGTQLTPAKGPKK